MKTKNIQAAFWGIVLSVAIAIPTSVTAQNKSRNDRQPHSSVKKQKQKHQKQVANYNYQRDRRYQNHKNKHKHYQKGVYKTGYNQHAHQIHNYYPSYSKGGYKTVFNCLPPKTHVVYFNGHKYYHHNKVYYRNHASGGYVMVKPPKYVQAVPQGSIKVNYNGRLAYYFGGVYFSWTPYGYIIL